MEKDARDKLLQAALPLFPQKGYAGVSIREIADKAGVNSASISYYFGGKAGLYAVIIESLFSDFDTIVPMVSEMLETAGSFAEAFGDAAMKIHQRSAYLMKYLFMELNNPTEQGSRIIQKYIKKIYEILYKGIERGIEKGEFRQDLDIPNAVLALSGIINFYFIVTPIRKLVVDTDDEAAYISQALDLYFNGIRRKDHA